jgi:hypothetical protein
LGYIPKGYLGTQKTLEHIKALIRNGAKDFYVRQKAIDILLEKGIKAKDYLGEIKALFEWVQNNVRYTKDPFRVEVLHTARRMLELRAGDCDDMTILLGAMLEAIGHPVRLIVTGPDPLRPKLFSHIYLEAYHKGQWIALDATMPYPMGWEPQTFVKQVIPIERKADMMRQSPVEFHSIAALAPVPTSTGLPDLIQSMRQGGIKPRDPRIQSLLKVLRHRRLLNQKPILARKLDFIWRSGLSSRPYPKTARRLERLLQRSGLLPAPPTPVTMPPTGQTPGQMPVPAPGMQPVTLQPMPGVMLQPVAQVIGQRSP